ncbi:MAG: hypothetical protein E7352_06890 [Clostridiales bacterium]|nr:hypothetical protein [Clostridiales bacterium]
MKIYFLSAIPCALRLGGVFFGMTDRFERYAEISLKDNVFVEFLPENALPVTFFLTDNIRFSPPLHCEVYLLADGIAIYAAEFIPTDFTLKTLWQKRLDDTLFTLFSQGQLQLAVESPEYAFTAYLPPTFCEPNTEIHGEYIALSGNTRAGKRLLVFRKNGERVLDEHVLSYTLSGEILRAELPLSERLGRTAVCAWSLSGDFQRTEFSLRARASAQATDGKNALQIPDDLLAYAFFESVLIGADYADFLSDELAPDKDKIVGFLGDFIDVVLTDDPLVCGLVRKRAERLFSLSYYRVKIQNGKIIDVNG